MPEPVPTTPTATPPFNPNAPTGVPGLPGSQINGPSQGWPAYIASLMAPTAGAAGVAALMSLLFSGRGGPGGAATPAIVPPIWPGMQQPFGEWLLGNIGQGAPAYPGQLNPSQAGTRLPEVFGSWQPWDAGTSFIANYVGTPAWQMSPFYGDIVRNTMSEGGPAGQPLRNMSNMTQFGGTGGPGNMGVANTIQFGGPSSVANYMGNQAQFGISAEGAGRPLVNRAYGANPAALQYLMPFLQLGVGSRFTAPSIQPRQLTRRNP